MERIAVAANLRRNDGPQHRAAHGRRQGRGSPAMRCANGAEPAGARRSGARARGRHIGGADRLTGARARRAAPLLFRYPPRRRSTCCGFAVVRLQIMTEGFGEREVDHGAA